MDCTVHGSQRVGTWKSKGKNDMIWFTQKRPRWDIIYRAVRMEAGKPLGCYKVMLMADEESLVQGGFGKNGRNWPWFSQYVSLLFLSHKNVCHYLRTSSALVLFPGSWLHFFSPSHFGLDFSTAFLWFFSLEAFGWPQNIALPCIW